MPLTKITGGEFDNTQGGLSVAGIITASSDLLVSGNLGVGITNPGVKLDVNGNLTARGTVLVNTSSSNTNGVLQVNGTLGLAPNSQIRQWNNADSGTLQLFATQVVASPNNSGSYGYADGATIAAVTNSDGSVLLDIGRVTTSSTRFRIGNTSSSNCYMQLGSTLYADTGAGNFQFNSGYGSAATAYGCRAWASFNGTNGAISASGNVSSITRTGAGNYTLNFSNAMPDSNYAFTGTTTDSGGGFFINLTGGVRSTTQQSFAFVRVSPLANADSTISCVAVFR